MTPKERELIKKVADRLQKGQRIKKDAQADQYIQKVVSSKRNSGYLLTQTVIVQDIALVRAQKQITQLKHQLHEAKKSSAGTGFFAGLFGSAKSTRPDKPVVSQPRHRHQQAKHTSQENRGDSGKFSDFMLTAASVATGITAGHYLVEGINDYLNDPDGSIEPSLSEAESAFLEENELSDTSSDESYFSEEEAGTDDTSGGSYYAEEESVTDDTSDENYFTEEESGTGDAYAVEKAPEDAEQLVAEESVNRSCEVEEDSFIDEIGENLWS